jgi:hypothetical protein
MELNCVTLDEGEFVSGLSDSLSAVDIINKVGGEFDRFRSGQISSFLVIRKILEYKSVTHHPKWGEFVLVAD